MAIVPYPDPAIIPWQHRSEGKVLRVIVIEASLQLSLPLEDILPLHEFDYLRNTLVEFQFARPDYQLRIGWGLVG